jgi:hypothetical protein
VKKTITLEADDFGPLNHRLDVIRKLRDRYKDFKITMFTIPWDIRFNTEMGGTPISKPEYSEWVNIVRHGVEDGWLEIAVHGLTHAPREFEGMEARLAVAKVKFAEKFFEDTKIPFVKIFKAPQWLISDEAKNAIETMGYLVVEDGYYNWNYKDDFPVELDNIIGHGHIQDGDGCNNGLSESLIRLVQVPNEYEWKFLSEVLKGDKNEN